jgi:hypothetical protein
MYWAAVDTAVEMTEWPAETVVAADAVAGSSVVWTVAVVSWLVGMYAYSQSLAQDFLTVNLREDQ